MNKQAKFILQQQPHKPTQASTMCKQRASSSSSMIPTNPLNAGGEAGCLAQRETINQEN